MDTSSFVRAAVSRRSLLRGAAAGAGLFAAHTSSLTAAGAQRAAPPTAAQAAEPEYSLWFLEYANVPEFPVSGMLYGAHNRGTMRVPFGYTVIKGEGVLAVFDVGFNIAKAGGERLANTFGVKDWESPEVVLGKIGLSPADVTHAFIGHAHFDHMGNIPGFPNAGIYVQEREITEWMNALQFPAQLGWVTGAVDPQDVMDATQAAVQQRLVLVRGEMRDVLPGVHLFPAWDTHTFGTQYATVTTGSGEDARTFVCAGDAIYWYANVEGAPQWGIPEGTYTPLGYGQGNQVTQLQKMLEMVEQAGGSPTQIIPGHDARIFERYPSKKIGPNSVAEIHLAPGEPSRLA
jgi:N-acyl homoserine lactone hydrolase